VRVAISFSVNILHSSTFHFQSTFCIPVQSLTLKNNSSRHRYQHFCLLRTFLPQPIAFVHSRAYATLFKITVKTTVLVHILNLGSQMPKKQAIRPFCVHFKMSLIKMACLFAIYFLSYNSQITAGRQMGHGSIPEEAKDSFFSKVSIQTLKTIRVNGYRRTFPRGKAADMQS
jgi:hypothetical protein